ncbi:hypothetical protein ACROYT_G021965 [Oculina patagonica]
MKNCTAAIFLLSLVFLAVRVDGKCGSQIDTKWAVCLKSQPDTGYCPFNYLKLETKDACKSDEVCCFVRPKINLKLP